MPISQSAKKSLRVSKRNHKVNLTFKTNLKLVLKDYVASPTIEGLKKVYSILDKATKNNLFHKNKTARLKAKFNKLATASSEAKPVAKKSTKKM